MRNDIRELLCLLFRWPDPDSEEKEILAWSKKMEEFWDTHPEAPSIAEVLFLYSTREKATA